MESEVIWDTERRKIVYYRRQVWNPLRKEWADKAPEYHQQHVAENEADKLAEETGARVRVLRFTDWIEGKPTHEVYD